MKKLLTFLMFFLLATIAAQAETKTVTKNINDIVTENGYTVSVSQTINTKCLSIDLDDYITVSIGVKEGATGNTGTFWGTTAIDWRLYQLDEPTITITAKNNSTLSSVMFNYSNSNTGVINISGNGTNITSENQIISNKKYDVTGSNVTYYVGNSGTKTNGQARIIAIEVTYTTGGDTPTPTTYNVTIANDITNGTVTASPTSAAEGDEVTLTATPATGYEFGSWNVTNASTSAAITVNNNKFKMPAANVNVSATFNLKQQPSGDETEITWIASEQGYTNGTQYTSATVDENISLAFGDGGNDGKYYDTGTGIRLYANGKMTVSATEGYEISKIVITYSASGYAGTFSANTGDYLLSEATGTWTGSAASVVLTNTANSGHARIQKVVVTYKATKTPPTPEKTLIGIEATGTPAEFWKGDAFNHDGITVTATWEDETETDVTSFCKFSGYDMSTTGEQTVTVSYQGETCTYKINVQTIANTQETAYTVAKAKALIDAGKDLATEVYVKGTVSKIDSFNETYGSITYWISEDGTTTNQFEVYGGLALSEAKFSAKEDLTVGDDVIVYGTIKDYNGTYEFDVNNYLVKWDKVATLSIADITVELNEDIVPVITTNVTGEYLIEYVSNNEEVVLATDDEMVTMGLGTATITATLVADGYKTAETTFTVTVAAKTYAINIAENIENGSVEASVTRAAAGTDITLTATPDDGYKFEAWNVKDASNNTITVTDNKFTMPAANVTVSATFDEKTKYEIAWMVNGTELEDETKEYVEGSSITAPENPKNIADYKFVGWSKKSDASSVEDIEDLTNYIVQGDENFYAVFAKVTSGNKTEITDVITRETTGKENGATGYSDWSNKKVNSDAIYAGNSAGGNNSIQIRTQNGNSGIYTTQSGGYLKKISVVFESHTTDARTLNVYGNTIPYTKANELYNGDTDGDKLGSFKYIKNEDKEYIIDNIPANTYTHVGFKSDKDPIYISSISITWVTGTPDTYSDYTTIVNVQNRDFYLNHTWGGTDTWWNKLIPNGDGTYSLNAVCGNNYNEITVGSNNKSAQQSRYLKEENITVNNEWDLESIETVGNDVVGENCTFAYNPVGNELTIVSKDVTYYVYNNWKGDGYSWRPLNRANPDGSYSTTGAFTTTDGIIVSTEIPAEGETVNSLATDIDADGAGVWVSSTKTPENTYTYYPSTKKLTIRQNAIVTGIEDVEVAGSAVKAYKVIENGQVIIVRGDQRFNIMGQPVR